MPRISQIDNKRFAKQLQQNRRDPLPLQSVDVGTLSVAAKNYALGDAVVGTAMDVSSGFATHSSLQSAHDSLPAGSVIFVRRTILTEPVTISKRLYVYGYGYDSQLNGSITLATGCSFSTLRSLRFGGILSVSVGADGNMLDKCFFANDPHVTNAGAGTLIDGVIE